MLAPLGHTAAWAEDEAPQNALARAHTTLQERGLELGLGYTVELFSNVSGGIEQDTKLLDNLDLTAQLDLERLLGWRGATGWLYVLANHGGNPSEIVGDLQAVSNIEAPTTWRAYEAWIEQRFAHPRASVRAGLYDVNAEFDVIPSAALFSHSSHGIGADFGLSGRNGPSIFPVTSLAVRARVRLADKVYVQGVVADGVPGDPKHPRRNSIMLGDGDGGLWVVESGVRTYRTADHAEPGPEARHASEASLRGPLRTKLALGVWGFTTDRADFSARDVGDAPLEHGGSLGSYLLGEHSVYVERDDPEQGLRCFARIGFADARTNPVDRYLGGGAVYRGLFRTRAADVVGISVAAARVGPNFRRALENDGVAITPWEVAFEATYRLQLYDALALGHTLQYVLNPGGRRDLDHALALSLRLALALP